MDPTPDPEGTAANAAVRLVPEAEADLFLDVTNQSSDDEEVRVTVEIDGVTVVDGPFHVEDQHNWVRFPLALPSGRHEITAKSDSGATMRASFEIPRDKTRFALIEHLTEHGSADLTWQLQRQPMIYR